MNGVIQMENNQIVREHDFRVGYKQTAKGLWYAEFTIRADTLEDLEHNTLAVKNQVNKTLMKLNDLLNRQIDQR